MKQRVSIARALSIRPEVLILDEPFGALDAITKEELQEELLKIWQDKRCTVLMITHDIDEALFLCDRLVMMTNGPAATPASATADTTAEGPPPALLVCTQANPFEHNASFLDDVATLAAAAARFTPGRFPRFTPLGVWSGGERLIYCDASGAPHQPKLLPIERTWRSLFGTDRPLPLWFGFTPGALFAISRDALSRTPLSVLETALGPEGGLCSRVMSPDCD
jgi:energy-coupling factor transporter ATP-binding protein EcfA2